jgi:hypothetical protein
VEAQNPHPRESAFRINALNGQVKYWDGNRPLETRKAPKKLNPLYNAARSGFRDILVQAHGQEVAREPMVSVELEQVASSTAFDPGRGAGLNANLIFKQSGFPAGCMLPHE